MSRCVERFNVNLFIALIRLSLPLSLRFVYLSLSLSLCLTFLLPFSHPFRPPVRSFFACRAPFQSRWIGTRRSSCYPKPRLVHRRPSWYATSAISPSPRFQRTGVQIMLRAKPRQQRRFRTRFAAPIRCVGGRGGHRRDQLNGAPTPTILAMSPADGEAGEGALTRGSVLSRSVTVNSTEDFDDFDAEGGTMDEEDFERLERLRQNSQSSVQVSMALSLRWLQLATSQPRFFLARSDPASLLPPPPPPQTYTPTLPIQFDTDSWRPGHLRLQLDRQAWHTGQRRQRLRWDEREHGRQHEAGV